MICTVKDLPIYYEVYGAGRPLLILHGFTPDHRLMTGCLEPLFARQPGWLRIYPDLPGMGQTPARAWVSDADAVREVLLAFADQALPASRFGLIGQSYGGYLARGLLEARPARVAGLCLLCPCAEADEARRVLPAPRVLLRDEALLASLPAADREAYAGMAVMQTRPNWEHFRDHVLPGLRAADSAYLERYSRTGYAFRAAPAPLPTPFAGPTLILAGRQDAVVGYANAWAQLDDYPRATFAVLDSAGHDLQFEQPQIFETLVAEWLERLKREWEA